MTAMMISDNFQKFVKLALKEDFDPLGDITTNAIFDDKDANHIVVLNVQSRSQTGIMSGSKFAKYVFENLTAKDEYIEIDFAMNDGERFKINSTLATIKGPIHLLLKGERLFLNLLQRATSIATHTNQFIEKVKNTKVKILDTRKTTPCMRELEKTSVKDGGGFNHRFNLSTGILIKDNHIALAGSIEKAIQKAKMNRPYLTQIEIEVDSLDQFKKALLERVDVILLDNFCVKDLREAVKINGEQFKGECLLEASGGVNLNNVLEIAETGVDYISIGSLTQSPPLIDIGLDCLV